MKRDELEAWADSEEEEDGGWACGYEAARRKARELIKNSRLTPQLAVDVASSVPHGWRFYTCDFSMNSSDKKYPGRVMFKRDAKGFADYMTLSEESRAGQTIYATGSGYTFEEALADAVADALHLGPIKTWREE